MDASDLRIENFQEKVQEYRAVQKARQREEHLATKRAYSYERYWKMKMTEDPARGIMDAANLRIPNLQGYPLA